MKKLFYFIPALLIIGFTYSCNSENDSGDESKKSTEEKTEQADNQEKTEQSDDQKNAGNTKTEKRTTQSNMSKTHQKIEFDAFSYLSKLKITDKMFVKYNKDITEVIDKELRELEDSHPLSEKDGPASISTYTIKTKINKNSRQYYHIVFGEGPSADPHYKIYPDGDIVRDHYTVSAERLYLPGNGNIYTAGHANNKFNKRQKYTINKGELQEVKQPYYYVGLETKTNKDLSVYSDKNKSDVIAGVPANYNIEVLIYDKDTRLFLIRTEFGLTGWVDVSTFGQIDIKGLYFAGD